MKRLAAGDRLRVEYELTLARGETARAKAEAIAREQSVEIPPRVAARRVEERTIGRVVEAGKTTASRARAVIDYPWRELVSDLPQLLNLLFGNISLQRGVRVAAIGWPDELATRLPGPRHGVTGVRARLGVERRPLLAAVLKPIGLSARELALHAADAVLAGIDLLKDDHSLSDQPAAPFRERIFRVAETVRAAARQSGTRTLYLPNLTGPVDRIGERLEDLREAGIDGALVAPMILGLDTVRSLAASSGLVLIAHPAMTGAFFAPRHGLAPELLLGDLFRLAGADIVDYPVPEGRFAFTRRDERALLGRLSAPLGGHRASFPMAAGGIDARKLRRLLPRYGADTIFLIGGNLYRGGRVRENARELVALVAR